MVLFNLIFRLLSNVILMIRNGSLPKFGHLQSTVNKLLENSAPTLIWKLQREGGREGGLWGAVGGWIHTHSSVRLQHWRWQGIWMQSDDIMHGGAPSPNLHPCPEQEEVDAPIREQKVSLSTSLSSSSQLVAPLPRCSSVGSVRWEIYFCSYFSNSVWREFWSNILFQSDTTLDPSVFAELQSSVLFRPVFLSGLLKGNNTLLLLYPMNLNWNGMKTCWHLTMPLKCWRHLWACPRASADASQFLCGVSWVLLHSTASTCLSRVYRDTRTSKSTLGRRSVHKSHKARPPTHMGSANGSLAG